MRLSLSKTDLAGVLTHTVRTPRPISSSGVAVCERLHGESVDGNAIFVSGSTRRQRAEEARLNMLSPVPR